MMRGGQLDSKILSTIVHDLRTPLGVLKLSVRIIDHQIPKNNPELLQDLQVLRENIENMESMLTSLADYGHLLETPNRLDSRPFDPRRAVREIVEILQEKTPAAPRVIPVEVQDDCPVEVRLDERGFHQAIQYALKNAIAAANGHAIHVQLRGGDSARWSVAIRLESPPPKTVEATVLRPDAFERLAGIASNRLGLDLAIVAFICERVGGSARLETEPDQSTTIVLDWPTSATV